MHINFSLRNIMSQDSIKVSYQKEVQSKSHSILDYSVLNSINSLIQAFFEHILYMKTLNSSAFRTFDVILIFDFLIITYLQNHLNKERPHALMNLVCILHTINK